jgi:penicillin-binding protein 1C
VISVISFLAMFASLALAPPAFDDIRAAWRPSDIRVLDRHGAVVHEVRVDIRRRRLAWTAVNDVSPALIDAVLAAEDRRFGGHRGVDGRALAAAAWQRVRHGSVRGASTITMQVAAMVDPALGRSRGARTAAEKWRQMRLAWGLEARWSKRQILETYLNLVTFRGELQGVAAGAAVLFDKSPHGLDDGEAAVLAALLRAPNAAPEHVARRAARLQTAPTASVAAAATRAGMTAAGTGPRVSLARHAATRLVRGQTGAGDVSSTLDLDVQRTASAALVRHLS